eukprot:EG_transcript_7131
MEADCRHRHAGPRWWRLLLLLAGVCSCSAVFLARSGTAPPPSSLWVAADTGSTTARWAGRVPGTQRTFVVPPQTLHPSVSSSQLALDSHRPSVLASLSLPLAAGVGGGLLASIALWSRRSRHHHYLQPLGKSLGQLSSYSQADEAAERRRYDQRVVYHHQLWRRHRAASRFFRAFPSIAASSILRQAFKPVAFVTAFSALVCAAQAVWGVSSLFLPTSLFALSGPTLGLLLVFRTNASYERWDGARKMIGVVKNRSEDLVRQMCSRFPADQLDRKKQMLRYIHAFFFALKVHLRSGPGGMEDDRQLEADLAPILRPAELRLVQAAANRPAHILHCITRVIHATGLQNAALICMDNNLQQLSDVIGGCERILTTPIPLSYTRMTTRCLLSWLALLPLSLSVEIAKLGCSIWLTVPCVAFIAFVLLGVEEVAVQIEEPFTILPLEVYAESSRTVTGLLFSQMGAVDALIEPPSAMVAADQSHPEPMPSLLWWPLRLAAQPQ